MKYIRTQDGRIINIQEFIDERKESPYYKEHKFEKLKNEMGECVLRWTAVGTEENSIEEQRGQRCQFCARVDSPFVKQSDKLKDLIDNILIIEPNGIQPFIIGKDIKGLKEYAKNNQVFGAIWVIGESKEPTLKSVVKLNDKKEWELL